MEKYPTSTIIEEDPDERPIVERRRCHKCGTMITPGMEVKVVDGWPYHARCWAGDYGIDIYESVGH